MCNRGKIIFKYKQQNNNIIVLFDNLTSIFMNISENNFVGNSKWIEQKFDNDVDDNNTCLCMKYKVAL